jgi:hypothetical protein
MSKQLLIENIKDKIELRFTGYHVEGEAVLQHWSGGTGFIQMKPFDVDASNISNEDELNEIIKSLINDNGFGCQRIMGAFIVLFAKYSNEDELAGTKIHVKDYYLNKDVIKTPQKYIDMAEEMWYEVM